MLNKIIIFLIQAIRPLLGPSGVCRYHFSCYDFAIEQFNTRSLFYALWATSKRVLSCSPLKSLF